MKLSKILALSFFFLFFNCSLFPATKGSETVVSIEPSFSFSAADSDNTMLGFGWFKNGFALEDATTTCTFNSVYPVSGTVNLNGGTIYLSQDLVFKNITDLQGWGTIIGNNYLVDFCSSIQELPVDAKEFENTNLFISTDLNITSTITFKGTCYLNGSGNTITLSSNGAFVVDEGATLTLKNVKIVGISDEKIQCAGNTSTLILDNVTWVQDGNFVYNTGSISFYDRVAFSGPYTFTYQSTQASTIKTKSIWSIQDKMTLDIQKQSGGQEPIICEDTSSTLGFHNSYLSVGSEGFLFTDGCMTCFGEVTVDIVSTDTVKGFHLGNGITADDPILELNPGAVLTFNSGHVVWDIADDTNVRFLSRDAWVKRTAQSKFHIKQDFTLGNVTINTAVGATTTFENNATMQYNGALFALLTGVIIVTGEHYATGVNLLNGNDFIFLNNGTLPLATVASGAGNSINGSGSIVGQITLLDPTAELTIGIDGSIAQHMTLNGGKIILGAGLKFDADKCILDSGIVDIGSRGFALGPVASTWPGNITWQGNGGSVVLNAETTLTGTWKFENNCTLQGNGNILDMSNGRIEIADGVKLTLRDIQMNGIQDASVQCLGDNSSLVLDDVIWVQSDMYTFDTGSIRFVHDVDFLGSYTFSYDSNQTSTIALKSNWRITDHMWFSVGRNNGNEPLYFEGETATLTFDNCTHHVTSGGMQAINGRMMYTRDVAVIVDSVDIENCLELGNGSASEDMIFEFAPGATVHFEKGHLVYNNVDPEKIVSRSTTARLERTAETHIQVEQSATLANLTIDSSPFAVTILGPGTTLLYENCIVVLPTGVITLTGDRYSSITNLLNGSDSIFLSTGQLSMITFVTGAGNNLYGNGSIIAPITLLDSFGQLTIGLNGSLGSDVTLNGGTITLASSVRFDADNRFVDSGSVDVAGNSLMLGSSDSTYTGSIDWQAQGGSVVLQSEVSLLGTWTFTGNCTLRGNGNVLDLSQGGRIEVAQGSTLTIRNIQIMGLKTGSIRCLADSSVIKLDDMYWAQEGHFIFDKGSLLFVNEVDFAGSYSFSYESVQTSTIEHNSLWRITEHMDLCIGKNNGVEPLYFEDSTSTLSLDNCILHIAASGMNIINGRVLYTRDVSVDIDSTDTTQCLIVGDGNPVHDMTFEFNPGASVSINSGHIVHDVVTDGNVLSRSTTAVLKRTAASAIHMKKNLILENLTIDVSPYAVTTFEAGADLTYENCVVILPTGVISLTGARYNAITNLLGGNKSIFVTTGQLIMHTLVQGTGNNLFGNGLIAAPITLADSSAELTLSLDGAISDDVNLNGGKVILGQDTRFGCKKHFKNDGTVVIGGNHVSFGPKDADWSTTLYLEGSGGIIELNATLALSGKLTFSGNVLLNGNGNTLDLGQTGELVTEAGSTLRLKDIEIHGVHGTNIRCADNESKIIFDNTIFDLSDDARFETGSFNITSDFTLSGSHVYAYQTTQVSTVEHRARLVLDNLVTFSYDPTVADKNLLEFEDKTSKVFMDNATFYATTVGLNLTKGTLIAKNKSCLSSEGILEDEAIVLGDGVLVENDFDIDVLPESTLRFSGKIISKDID